MASKPQRIQLSRRKGWRMPPNTVKVDRSTKWGNPFVTGLHGTRDECVKLHTLLMGGHLCISYPSAQIDAQRAHHAYVTKNVGLIRGKNLACWCPLGAPCHADILLKVANG